jgi:hypothetical protein
MHFYVVSQPKACVTGGWGEKGWKTETATAQN